MNSIDAFNNDRCPNCGSAMQNRAKQEIQGKNLTLCWTCTYCHARTEVNADVFIKKISVKDINGIERIL